LFRRHILRGQRIGYVRVSSFDQNPERQLDQVQVDKLFTDKASGKDTQRPQLGALLSFAREGDTVVVHSMDRLARNLDDLRRLVLACRDDDGSLQGDHRFRFACAQPVWSARRSSRWRGGSQPHAACRTAKLRP